ncbi:MAG: TonB-dependent receptor [Candidatus Thioglobus sp.]|uniref:TonB-dependent receptor plug domain-containing protein n=1 Tax=Candidatus Thioglobus sp. TaxID=2026721 RepID=UPI002601B8F8|nr:TonB-dependent receptor [Candidatus Thioglobus sp.]MDC9727301.1 TonB-dependent receptor [Candidatus Thioglobus sp.]
MNIKQLSLAAAVSALTFTTATNAVLGPIPIYLNTEYRTDAPVIGSIASTLNFDAEDIKATGANSFIEFLESVPSVEMWTGNVPAIFMRGGPSNHTLVVVDGVKINPPNSTNGAVEYGLTNVPINDIEKIEIVKGSGSVLYGSSAVTGVIAITTKQGSEEEHATVGTKFGTNNTKIYTLTASNGGKDGFVRFTHNKYSTDGINARSDDTTNEKDAISSNSTQIKFGNERFSASYLKTGNRIEYDDQFGGSNDQYLTRDSSKISINANNKISDIWKARFQFTQIDAVRKAYKDGGFSWGGDGDNYQNTTIIALNDININNALLNIGLSQSEDKNTVTSEKLTSKDLFVNWQQNINNVDISTGARYIKHSKAGNKTIYNLGASKHLENSLKLTGAYGTSFSAPTLGQLAGNPNLKPEISKNIELGIEKQHTWGMSSITIYNNTSTNAFRSDGTTGWVYENIGRLRTKGIEASLNTNIANYDIDFGYNYNKSRENDRVLQSIRRPQNTTHLTIGKQYGKFNPKVQIIKKSSSLDNGDIKLDGYMLINLSTNYDINDSAKVSLSIKNATNKDYSVANKYNQPGRVVNLGLDYKF